MKKTLLIAMSLVVGAAGALAQGNVQIGGTIHTITDNYTTPGTTKYSSGIDIALLFAPVGSGAAAIGSNPSSTSSVYSTASAWAAITGDLGGSSWFMVDGTTGTPLIASITGTAGTFAYNGNNAWSAANVVGGVTYMAYEVAWSTGGGLYNTLAQAAQAGAFVGWSQAFTYTPTSGSTQPVLISNGPTLAGPFTVGGTIAAVPEPTTMALAGLGIAGLLALRRKK